MTNRRKEPDAPPSRTLLSPCASLDDEKWVSVAFNKPPIVDNEVHSAAAKPFGCNMGANRAMNDETPQIMPKSIQFDGIGVQDEQNQMAEAVMETQDHSEGKSVGSPQLDSTSKLITGRASLWRKAAPRYGPFMEDSSPEPEMDEITERCRRESGVFEVPEQTSDRPSLSEMRNPITVGAHKASQMSSTPPHLPQAEEGNILEDEHDLMLGHLSDDDVNKAFRYPTYIDNGQKPSLSLEQLTVLAIAESPNRSLTLKQICSAISSASKYYNEQDLNSSANSETCGHAWIKTVEDVLHQYDFLTVPTFCPDKGELNFSLPTGNEWWVLNRQSKGKGKPFKFMKLPFELRLMIYTWTLHHPLPSKQGWAVDAEYTLKAKELYDRYDRLPQRLTTKGPGDWELRTRPLDQVLALTMANRAIQAEALPVFYRSNYFYFSSPKVMGRFYAGIRERTKWMRSVILNFAPPRFGHECKRSIAKLIDTKLRNLHIIVDENQLLITHAVENIQYVPGVKFLGELGGLDQVSFEGNSERLKSYLADMQITSAKTKKNADYDTDETMDDIVARARKTNAKDLLKAFKQHKRNIMQLERQQKRDEHKLEMAKRAREQQKLKAKKMKQKDDERERKRAAREQTRIEKDRRKEEIEEEKALRRMNDNLARMRKKKEVEDEKARKREERELAQQEKARRARLAKKEKDGAAEMTIKELKKSTKAQMSGTKRKRSHPKYVKEDTISEEDNDGSSSSDDDESDSDSDESQSTSESSDEELASQTAKRRKVYYGGSIKGVANKVGGRPKAAIIPAAKKVAAISKCKKPATSKRM